MPMPSPHDGEQEHDFIARCHKALFEEFPDADARNAVCFSQWRKHAGESEAEKVAHAKFKDDEFEHIQNVPHFKEHDYPWMPKKKDGTSVLDDDGQPVIRNEHYDFDSLKAMCDNMNFRIEDTGDFSPLTDKHRPKPGSPDQKEPGLMGFAGPFGLGMVGNKEPKWGIIAKQEHWFKDKAHLAREFPRRSPEVYLGRPMEKRIMDPVTVLGGNTPALDMGIHYSEVGAAGDESIDEQFAYYSGPAILATYAATENCAQYARGIAYPASDSPGRAAHAAAVGGSMLAGHEHHQTYSDNAGLHSHMSNPVTGHKYTHSTGHFSEATTQSSKGHRAPGSSTSPSAAASVGTAEYSGMAFPGACNTFAPSLTKIEKKHYAANPSEFNEIGRLLGMGRRKSSRPQPNPKGTIPHLPPPRPSPAPSGTGTPSTGAPSKTQYAEAPANEAEYTLGLSGMPTSLIPPHLNEVQKNTSKGYKHHRSFNDAGLGESVTNMTHPGTGHKLHVHTSHLSKNTGTHEGHMISPAASTTAEKKTHYAEAPEEPPAPEAVNPGAPPAAPPPAPQLGQPSPAAGTASMISPEDANTIIKALMETEPMQWVLQQMGADKAPKQDVPGAQQPGAEPPPLAPQEPPADALANEPPAAVPAEQAPGGPPHKKQQMSEETSPELVEHAEKPVHEDVNGDGTAATKASDSGKEHPMATAIDTDKVEKDKKAAYDLRHQERVETAQYAALREELDALKLENAENKKKAAISERAAKINSYRLMGFDIDVDAETQRCSLENMPSEREFQTALDLMIHYAGRIPVGITLHTPDQPIIEDRHKAAARARNRNLKAGEPEFVHDEDFMQEVQQCAYELQCRPEFTAKSASVYEEAKRIAIERRQGKPGDAAKVG